MTRALLSAERSDIGTPDAELVSRATSLVPLIREHAARGSESCSVVLEVMRALGRVPASVAVVTASARSEPVGMTIGSFTSVGPPVGEEEVHRRLSRGDCPPIIAVEVY